MNRVVACCLAGVSLLSSCSLRTGGSDGAWEEAFRHPSAEARPWTFWYWMHGAVSDAGICADLKGMKGAGIEGFYLMPIKDTLAVYGGTARQLSPEWWERVRTVYSVADSLGLQMGIHFSDGFALAGGPWIEPHESMQKVVFRDTIVHGGDVDVLLDKPAHYADYYEDIMTYAFPADDHDARRPAKVDFPIKSSEPTDITFAYKEAFTLRSVKIVTGGNNYQAHRWDVSASQNGRDYEPVCHIEPARQGWQNTDAYATYAVPATTARFFRFHWTPEGSDPGAEDMDAAKWKPTLKVADIILGSEPVVDGFEGKSGLVWRVSKAFVADNDGCPLQAVRAFALEGDRLKASLPAGRWHILRMGHTSTGHTNATGGGGKGLECDKFSKEAVAKQADHWFGEIFRHAPSETVARRVLTRLHVDSWECGSQNWSEGFAEEFKCRRGYDLMPYMPVFAGVPVGGRAKADSVLRDVRQTIADLVVDVFFAEVRRQADSYGVSLSAECVCPTMVSDGLRHYSLVDYPMGEFWLNSPTHDKPNDMLDAVSGAHIYGKNIVQAEGFTEVRGTWDETPARLKPLLDRSFAMGVNGIVFHVNTHNPWLDRRPGMTLDGIGTFFQRDNTWWREMPAFTAYIARCQSLLQYGSPVVDLAVYTGDETPRRALLPERLVETVPGLFGEEAVLKEERRLKNEGQPMETSPVGVKHTANMTKADMFTNPLCGYKYDSFNHDVLQSSKAEKGRLRTAGGMTYSALIVPLPHKLNPDGLSTAAGEIDRLRESIPVIEGKPWTEGDLTSIGIRQDALLPEGVDFAHRKGAEADIYFLCNLTDSALTFRPTLRDTRPHAYLADALTGGIYRYSEGEEIELVPGGSVFVVFSDRKVKAQPKVSLRKLAAQPLEGEWLVKFEDSDALLTTRELVDWTTFEDSRIRYYSGHAHYVLPFHVGKVPGVARLDLGDVRDVASVFVNSKYCGTVWTAPYVVDVTAALKEGENRLTVAVVNTWANALMGADKGTPPFEGIWTNGKYRRAESEPLPAGLLGPCRLLTGETEQ